MTTTPPPTTIALPPSPPPATISTPTPTPKTTATKVTRISASLRNGFLVKKWQTMIEAHIDVKTTDGYWLRLFCVGFTKKCNNQIRNTSYAQHQQVRQIRKKMMEIMTREVQTNDLKEVVNILIPDSIGKDIEKACQSIYPLHDVFIRKVKMLKKPNFELGKLMELHGEGGSSGKTTVDETGAKVERADGYEPPVQESV
ncbi:40S ribosomal protein S3a-like [Microtus oregoni]|uniref:40S ribosomal protein S3a-like n=1 Tax=Microtus oregoni TaxID=111838 RepID=UPI001BB1EE77|nr:40S ribosomal protein S3a-like [Microtus oregoni]